MLPPAVFILLETIYKAFDEIAKQYGIFKIETIGDCVSFPIRFGYDQNCSILSLT